MKTPDFHKFKIGNFNCALIKDLDFMYNAKDFATNASEDKLNEMLSKYHGNTDMVPSQFIALWIDTGDERILIDSGGGYSDQAFSFAGHEIFIKGQLLKIMKREGIDPHSIDKIILTHFHPDHIGGLYNDAGESNFPNAEFIFFKEEWDFWFSEKSKLMPPFFLTFIETQIAPLRDRNTTAISGSHVEFLSGMRAILMPGHTPGHMMVSIESEGEKLLYTTDTILHPMHLEKPDWKTAFDFDPEMALVSRKKLLELATKDNLLMCMFHFPFPGIGYARRENDHWVWEPSHQ